MLLPPCRLVLFDCTDNTLLMVDGSDGHILLRHSLASSYRPLALLADRERGALLAANSRTDGALLALRSDQKKPIRLPFVLPPLAVACLAPDGQTLFYASTRRTLYRLDLASGKQTALGSAPSDCTSLACDERHIYSVWETKEDSICAVHDLSGKLISEHPLKGTIPSLSLSGNILYLPFVGGDDCGEGLYLLSADRPESAVTTIPLRPPDLRGLSAYPYSVLVRRDTIHLVSESSGTITKLDRATHKIIGSYALGRSISSLHLLPDDRFAIATSNMFADLTLLDLVNEKLLSISICPHELFRHLVVLAPA